MTYHLTVVQPFALYKRGDHITDPQKVAEVLAGPFAHSVVKRHPDPEHLTGDFYRTDAELMERDNAVRAKLGVPVPDEK